MRTGLRWACAVPETRESPRRRGRHGLIHRASQRQGPKRRNVEDACRRSAEVSAGAWPRRLLDDLTEIVARAAAATLVEPLRRGAQRRIKSRPIAGDRRRRGVRSDHSRRLGAAAAGPAGDRRGERGARAGRSSAPASRSSIRSTAPRNSLPAATNSPSISRIVTRRRPGRRHRSPRRRKACCGAASSAAGAERLRLRWADGSVAERRRRSTRDRRRSG